MIYRGDYVKVFCKILCKNKRYYYNKRGVLFFSLLEKED